ncbi:MAG: flavin reductase family protein [Defluviitaleaceae bacterium]|nr:flavin reductase family protein [Defluviitaleaceae bacterium]MCL2836256.1 flavin reductase family protein [Defluviitaleaceae bacterium]
MKKIEKQSISQPNNIFQNVVWTLTPRPVWIVGTCNEDGSANLSTITCVSHTPGPPDNIIISMHAKRTNANIQRTGGFTINLANVEMAPLADYVGTVSGDDCVKDAVPYSFAWGEKIHAPVLDASPCAIECKVSQTHVIGNFHTFFGEIINLHIDLSISNPPMGKSQEAIVEWFNAIDIHNIDPLVYHSFPQKYYRVGEKVKY